MDMDEKLGKRIAALRRKRGWTQEKLAQQLGVSAAAVSKWGAGSGVSGYRAALSAGAGVGVERRFPVGI